MSIEDLEKWYKENMETLDLNDKEQVVRSVEAVLYLFNEKLGNWNKDDATFIIYYFSKKALDGFEIKHNTRISILNDEEYQEKYGKSSTATCINHGDNTYSVVYSPNVIKHFLANTHGDLLIGLQTIFHEVVHARQNYVIQSKEENKTKKRYLMSLETIARQLDPMFYDRFYDHLIKENQAQSIGLQLAVSMIKTFNKDLYLQYNQDFINKKLEEYKKNYYGKTLVTDNGDRYDFLLHEEAMAARYIENNPRNCGKVSCFTSFF